MNYEIVELEKKTVVGLNTTTDNDDPNMPKQIGDLWADLMQNGRIAEIKNKSSKYTIGLYSDYAGMTYQVTVGSEVSKSENPDMTTKIIPAGKYAKFTVHGNMVTAVAKAWEEIWAMNLDRTFIADFEEYLNSDFENADINLYISLK